MSLTGMFRARRAAQRSTSSYVLDRTTCAVLLLVVGALLALTIIVPMDVEQQMLFSAGCMIAALVLRRASNRLAILAMVVLSVVASLRYIY